MSGLVAGLRQFVLDGYTSALGHKAELDRPNSWGAMVPPWTGAEHHRRLTAYRFLEALFRNRGREFANLYDPLDRAEVREYGDAALLVHVVRSAVTGDDVSIVVDDDPDDSVLSAAAKTRQADYDAWARAESFAAKVLETERDTVKLGDGVFALTTSYEKQRVRLRLFSPECYFPVRDPDDAEDEFPSIVRIAWQEVRNDGSTPGAGYGSDDGNAIDVLRCITWRLAPRPAGPRALPWNDRSSALTCYLSDGMWDLADIAGREIDQGFPSEKARWRTTTLPDGTIVPLQDIDLDLDFIPVIHLPNTVEIKAGFGEATVTGVVQLLEDLARADTNAQKAADLAAVPMIGHSGSAGGDDLVVRSGTVIDLGADGKLSVIDLSGALRAVMDYRADLRKRLSSNSRLPAEVLGMTEASHVKAGIILALSFGPLRSLVEEMRMARSQKYPLLLKMVQRMSLQAQFWTGAIVAAEVNFGSYLPSDQAAVIQTVTALWSAHLVSRKTAITRLVEEGILNVDISTELEACESEDFAAALALLTATEGQDIQAVYDLLHLIKPAAVTDPALAPKIPTMGQTLPKEPVPNVGTANR